MSNPTIDHPLAQHEREMMVGAFLDITAGQWADWIQRVGDDAIPTELHRHVVDVITGLAESGQAHPDHTAEAYQPYLQALALLADDSLVWLVRQVGNSPL